MLPKDVRYTSTHEWVRLEDGEATVGITRYAANQLSDINYVELPSVGDSLAAETSLGSIESTETGVDLLSPIDGKVIEINGAVLETPELIAEDPYDDGWLIRLKPADPSQLDELMTADEYQIFVQAEAGEDLEEEEEAEVDEEEEKEVKDV